MCHPRLHRDVEAEAIDLTSAVNYSTRLLTIECPGDNPSLSSADTVKHSDLDGAHVHCDRGDEDVYGAPRIFLYSPQYD